MERGKWKEWRLGGWVGYREVWKRVASLPPSDGQVEGRRRSQEVYPSVLRGKPSKPQPGRVIVQGEVDVPGEDGMEGN